MRSAWTSSSLLAALLLAAVCSSAQTTPTTPALSAIPADFNFQGTWSCQGTMGNARLHRANFTGAVVLAGKWIELTEQDVEPATGYTAQYLIGYDAQAKQLVEFDANNFSAATYSSKEGWQHGVLTMTSPMSTDTKAPYVANRFTYTIMGPDSFTVDWQISRGVDLKWVAADHLACKRQTA